MKGLLPLSWSGSETTTAQTMDLNTANTCAQAGGRAGVVAGGGSCHARMAAPSPGLCRSAVRGGHEGAGCGEARPDTHHAEHRQPGVGPAEQHRLPLCHGQLWEGQHAGPVRCQASGARQQQRAQPRGQQPQDEQEGHPVEAKGALVDDLQDLCDGWQGGVGVEAHESGCGVHAHESGFFWGRGTNAIRPHATRIVRHS